MLTCGVWHTGSWWLAGSTLQQLAGWAGHKQSLDLCACEDPAVLNTSLTSIKPHSRTSIPLNSVLICFDLLPMVPAASKPQVHRPSSPLLDLPPIQLLQNEALESTAIRGACHQSLTSAHETCMQTDSPSVTVQQCCCMCTRPLTSSAGSATRALPRKPAVQDSGPCSPGKQ